MPVGQENTVGIDRIAFCYERVITLCSILSLSKENPRPSILSILSDG